MNNIITNEQHYNKLFTCQIRQDHAYTDKCDNAL